MRPANDPASVAPPSDTAAPWAMLGAEIRAAVHARHDARQEMAHVHETAKDLSAYTVQLLAEIHELQRQFPT
jgi:hypothetical protein